MVEFTALLERAARRVRTLLIIERASSLAALAIGLAAAFIGIDLVLRLPAFIRIALLAAWIGAVAWTLWRRVRPAWRLHVSPVSMALRLEARMPALGGRIASAMELSAGHGRDGDAASQRLAETVVSQVAPQLSDSAISSVIDPRPCRRRVRRLAVIGAAACALAAIVPAWTLTGVQRMFAPWSGAEWPARTALESRTEIRHHPRGAALPLAAELTRGDPSSERVWVRVRRGSESGRLGPWEESLAVRQAGTRFERLVEPGDHAIEFQFRTSDVETPVQRIEVVDPPRIASAVATIDPPAYARGAVQSRAADLGDATGSRGRIPDPVVVGSRIRVDLVPQGAAPAPDPADRPAFEQWVKSSFSLSTGGSAMQVSAEADSAGAPRWRVEWDAAADASLQVTVRDSDGVANVEPIRVDVTVVADRPPEVVVADPAADETVLPTAVIPVRIEARDDLGLVAVSAEATRQGTASTLAQERGSGTPRQSRLDASLDVAAVGAVPGDTIELRGVAADAYESDGKAREPSRSVPRRIRVLTTAQFDEELRAALAAVRQSAIRADERQRTLMERQEAPSEAVRPQGELSERLAAVGSTVAGLRSRLDRNRSGDDSVRSVLDAAEDLLQEASAQSNVARERLQAAGERMAEAEKASDGGDAQSAEAAVAAAEEARQAARAAQSAVRAELEDLAGLLDRDRDSWAATRQLQRVDESLARAEASRRAASARTAGRMREELDAGAAAELDRAAQDAEDAARAAREAMESLAERAERVKASDPARAESLARAVRRGEEASLESRADDAAQATRENRLDDASRAGEAAAEAVAQMMAELSDDERSRTETLRRRLASLKEALEGLVTRAESAETSVKALAPDAARAEAEALDAGKLQQQALAVADEARAGGPAVQRIIRTVERGAESAGRAAGALRRAPPAVADGTDALVRASALFREARDQAQSEERRNESRERERRIRALAQAYAALADRQEGVVTVVGALAEAMAASGPDRRRIMDARKAGIEQDSVRTAARAIADKEEDVRASAVLMNATEALSDAAVRASGDLREGTARAQTVAECREVLDVLRGLASALSEQASKREPFDDAQAEAGGQQGGGESPADEPVVPPVAELKVLRAVQRSLAERTAAVAAGTLEPASLAHVAQRQADIAELAEAVRAEIERRMREQGKIGSPQVQPEGAPDDVQPDGAGPAPQPQRFPALQRRPRQAQAGGAQVPSPQAPAGGASPAKPGAGAKSLDELLGIGGAAGQESATDAQRAAAEAERAAREKLAKVLTDDQTRDLMREIVSSMRRSAELLEERDSGTAVQRLQAETIAKLDALIESAQQRQQQMPQQSSGSPSSGEPKPSGEQSQGQGEQQGDAEAQRRAAEEARRRNQQPGQPGQQSTGEASGELPQSTETEAVQGGPLEQSEAEWGRLPARTREAVRQGLREKMSTSYRWWTEQYYRRIAEEARK